MTANVRRYWIPATALNTLGWSEGDVELVQAADFDALREDLASASSDKEAYAQNAIDLRKRAVAAEQRNAELAVAARKVAECDLEYGNTVEVPLADIASLREALNRHDFLTTASSK